MICGFRLSIIYSVIFVFTGVLCLGKDWPTWRADASRSGYTDEVLPKKLHLQWSRKAAHLPRPAWPRSDRMMFDRSSHFIVAEGMVFYGDSVEGRIRAVDSATGELKWTFSSRGPVRFAPTYFEGKVYANSDDGFLYCLNSADGSLVWKKRGGPGDEMILGNGRLISRWPARGGAVVMDGIVYFAAGIWPSDGVSLYALDPDNGKTLWVNDTAGSIYMGQPHGGAFAKSGVAAQGYLSATGSQIFMATGRAVPAAFDRQTGEFQYLALQENTKRGGAEVLLSDQFFINSGYLFNQSDGALGKAVGRGPLVGMPNGVAGAIGKELTSWQWTGQKEIDRKGKEQSVRALSDENTRDLAESGNCMIAAGLDFVIGRKGSVSVIREDESESLWTGSVEGTVYDLAVADGKLFVSTDAGILYCFGEGKQTSQTHSPKKVELTGVDISKEAEEIVSSLKIDSGYCLDLGCGDGQLALEIARRTELFVYAVDPDPENVKRARKLLTDAGVYGDRVMVFEAEIEDSGLPDYFANLVVSGRSLSANLPRSVLAETYRMSRPWGGMVITGKSGVMKVEERGALEGAGQWTHQYADPSNSVNSGDELIRGPLGMLWFSDLEQPMTQRHGRGPAPLFNKGVLYSEGLDSLIAVDAYNGHKLWEYSLPGILEAFDGDHLMGTSGTGSNYCVSDDSVFVRRGGECLKIDAVTGKLLATFSAPKKKGEGDPVWGYIAHEEGVLFGSISDTEHIATYRYRPGGDMSQQLTEAKAFFALDVESGELLWRYDAKHSLRHNAIAIGNKAVVLIDRPQASSDRRKETKTGEGEHLTGELLALDAFDGTVLWKNDKDIFGTVSAISKEHHAVMMSYQPTSFRLASEVGGRLAVYDLSTGSMKWETKSEYKSRPVINQDTIYAQGGAWDVLTGDERPFNFKRSYGCGILAGARDLMVYRSATLGYFDLTLNRETEDFGGIRPGCWINAIPAGGLVFAPDASAGCSCSYLNQSWIALQTDGVRAPIIRPSSPSAPDSITVEISADGEGNAHYTTDGTSPTLQSPVYEGPFEIRKSVTLKTRAFGKRDRPGPVAEQKLVINPYFVSLKEGEWETVDAARARPESDWRIEEGVIVQTSNIMVGGKETLKDTAEVDRPGSIFLLDSGKEFGSGVFSFEIRSTDNDALGFVMGYQDPENYHVWSICSERPYRALALKQSGKDYRVIGGVKEGFTPSKWHDVRVQVMGDEVAVFFDGKEDFRSRDSELRRGKIGFYTWGNSGSYFRNLSFVPAK